MASLVLALLELTFVMVSIMLFHSLKKTIGNAAFFLTLGMFFVLAQIVSSADLLVDPGLAGFQVDLGHTLLLAPYMVAILIVYVVDGTLEAQRMILGFLAILFGYFYLANVIASQCAWATIRMAASSDTHHCLESVFLQGRRPVVASFLANAVDFFVLPVIFQIFHNRRCRLFFSVLGTLVLTQVIDSFMYQLVAEPHLGQWWDQLRTTYLARATAMIILSSLTTVYLHMFDVEKHGQRRPLDIILDFFGAHVRAQELQKSIREWEGRYHIVVESTADLIFIVNAEGSVLNANSAALRAVEGDRRPGLRLTDCLQESDGTPCVWEKVWQDLHAPDAQVDFVHKEWRVPKADDSLELDAHVSKAELSENPVALVVARDVTARRRLENERQRLQEQLIHAQRMEAVGQLAGGVAHDFNNLLHTIQGSLDGLAKQWDLSDPSKAMIGNIHEATERASSLTQQLLGFARKGKYKSVRLDLTEVMEKVWALFRPVVAKDVNCKIITAPRRMIIEGDATQLQQVFLNLLLNARDSLPKGGEDKKIVFRGEPAARYTPGWEGRPDSAKSPDDYVCVRIKDNGSGIPEDVRGSIFDPFFTTKPVGEGTGMGLAMVYGCIGNHHGWIHVESELGKGSEFFVFLPRG